MTYAEHLNNSTSGGPASQREPRDERQVENSAGGYSYEADCWERLERFLIMGSDDGNYYASSRELTLENVGVLDDCIEQDQDRTIDLIVDVSESYRAPSNNPCIFALAYCLAYGAGSASPGHGDEGYVHLRRRAAMAVPKVCRTGSHIFRFADEIDGLRGWETLVQKAFKTWYMGKDVDELAYQFVKYQSRHGWSHADILRKVKPSPDPEEPARSALFAWAVGKWDEVDKEVATDERLERVRAYEQVKRAKHADEVWELVDMHNLPHECVPSRFRNDADVWESVLYAGDGMPVWALTRNLAKLTDVGVLSPGSDAATFVVNEILGNEDRIKQSGIHPIKILTALLTYKSGASYRGSLTWTPVKSVVQALDAAFYTAFDNCETTGQRYMLGLDISSSMTHQITGHAITARQACAAMAMVTARSEPHYDAVAFSRGLEPFELAPDESLDSVMTRMYDLPHGGTDCALPILHALEEGKEVDVFITYTDSETWAGEPHPQEALEEYRRQSGIDAKMITVAFQPNAYTIADPQDPLTMDCIGFDTRLPKVISEFVSGFGE